MRLLGIASARIEIKAYDHFIWMYVDVSSNHRQQGAGEHDWQELWLGTEKTNVAGNALYQSLDPDDVDDVVGYNYELSDLPKS